MKKAFLIAFLAVVISCNSKEPKGKSLIPADRWLEIDLYWFDKNDLQRSVETFWDRFGPLYEGVSGWKGVVLNVGWLMDYVFEWKGNMSDTIPLPAKMNSQKYSDYTPLTGTTADRKKQWEKRFSTIIEKQVEYQTWTYGELRDLVSTLRKSASEKHAIEGLRVGTLVLAWKSIYGGGASVFTKKHPQVYSIFDSFNPEARLNDDKTSYGSYPSGITQGTPVYEFFAGQWGDMSKKVGLDAIILRDSEIGTGVYRRKGPYGITAPSDPAKIISFNNAVSNYIKAVKMANSNALVIGYSSAASAVGDWRVNCFDLETIAKEGYLDAFIDQTWAGAWNEVGQRKETFWNYPYLGWTYQMAFMLIHGAVLADSKVRHYSLVETFDAWEPWDIIHTAPDRLRWGIWAYLHAAVKTPGGLKFPEGSYISWANQGKDLLSEADVKFLVGEINQAVLNAQSTVDISGPTLVYNRKAMEYMNAHYPDKTIKEWIDEQAGSVMKWSVPIFSCTRLEYLPNVHSDLFIFQTPVNLDAADKQNLTDMIKTGQPVAIWGSPAGGLDQDIARLTGISTKSIFAKDVKENGALVSKDTIYSKDIPSEFKLYQIFSENKADRPAQTIYSVNNSPALLVNESDNKQVVFWDPPELGENLDLSWPLEQPLVNYLGSVYPFVMSARSINRLLKNNDRFHVESISPLFPVSVAEWLMKDSTYRLLVAELEEGINDSADTLFKVEISDPGKWSKEGSIVKDIWSKDSVSVINSALHIKIGKSHSRLFIVR